MFNVFDMLQSQGGADMQAFGQQFGLSQEQTRRAMEALMPALTVGLQRNATSDPTGFGRFLGLVAPDPYAGLRPPMAMQPDQFLGQFFGSPLVSHSVLQQAAAASGIGTQALKQMLPVMAGMVVAGIIHVMINQPPAVAPPIQQQAPRPDPMGFPAANFWNDWMSSFMSPATSPNDPGAAGGEKRPVEKVAAPASAGPLTRQPSTSPAAKEASFEGLQEMMQTGMQVQEQNVKAMQDIFDAFWSTQKTSKAADEYPQNGQVSDPLIDDTKPAPEKSATPANKPARKIK